METNGLWKRVRELVKSHRISQTKFTDYISVSRSTYYYWLRHGISPDIYTAYNISTALGVSIEYLLTGTDNKGEQERMKRTEERKDTESQVKKLVLKLQEEVVKF